MVRKSSLRVLSVTVFTLAAVVGCEDEPPGKSVDESSSCRKLLGEAGVEWLSVKGRGGLNLRSEDDLKDVRSLIYRQMRAWNPDTADKYLSFADSEVCDGGRVRADGTGKFRLNYQASVFPFAEVPDRDAGMMDVAVNSDVILLHGKGRWADYPTYHVYFKCKIPGAPAEQLDSVPIEGAMVDNLTGETGARTRMKHLLHSAQVMARTLDCENDPVIPAEPPAAVK